MQIPSERLYTFIAGDNGPWRITRIDAVLGEPLAPAAALRVASEDAATVAGRWILRGVTSNDRYVTHLERRQLLAQQPKLDRKEATLAALIPIRKNEAWWRLSQDERRAIFETRSHHIGIGLEYLPAVARRLHHCRDLATNEPFDFLTWFEFAPQHERGFDELLARLRATEEWRYVEREVDVRLVRAS
jgi:chlorite dismutase